MNNSPINLLTKTFKNYNPFLNDEFRKNDNFTVCSKEIEYEVFNSDYKNINKNINNIINKPKNFNYYQNKKNIFLTNKNINHSMDIFGKIQQLSSKINSENKQLYQMSENHKFLDNICDRKFNLIKNSILSNIPVHQILFDDLNIYNTNNGLQNSLMLNKNDSIYDYINLINQDETVFFKQNFFK